MKLQWSIQSTHTQLVLSQVVYLNHRNEHIWPPTRKWLHIFEAFHLASLQIITFDHFWTIHLILRLVPEIFDISILRIILWLYGHHTFQYKSLSLFPSQILVCATASKAHYLFSFWDLHWLSSLSKNIKSVGRYIGISLCIYQNYQDYWSIIHDKFEDRFTIVTHRFQDFSPKDRCAYKTS